MSSCLTWEPVNRVKKHLSTELKFILRKRFNEPINVKLDENSISYLTGIAHADEKLDKEIDILVIAIRQYGEIILKEEY